MILKAVDAVLLLMPETAALNKDLQKWRDEQFCVLPEAEDNKWAEAGRIMVSGLPSHRNAANQWEELVIDVWNEYVSEYMAIVFPEKLYGPLRMTRRSVK